MASSSGDQGPLFTFALSQHGALPMPASSAPSLSLLISNKDTPPQKDRKKLTQRDREERRGEVRHGNAFKIEQKRNSVAGSLLVKGLYKVDGYLCKELDFL